MGQEGLGSPECLKLISAISYRPQVYYEPLKHPKAAALVEPGLVRDIFYQIPEICSVHQHFLQQLIERVEHWDSERKIGDIFINTVSPPKI